MNELAELRQRVAELEVMGIERRWGKESLPEYPERLQEMAVGRGIVNKRILIVEDSLVQVARLKNLLQGRGYWVTVATNGQEALAAAREREPDLIISDIIMPGMDGYEMCQAIKHDGVLRDIPVILLTVLSDTKDVIRALRAGVDYYLTKPYYENHLLSQVESALARPVRQKNDGAEEELEVAFGGERHVITSDRQQILNLLLSTYDNAVQQNQKLIKTQRELQKMNEQLQQEIIDRKQAEGEIRRLKDFNEGIVQNMAEGIAVEDAEGCIIFVNPAAADLLGYSPKELLGQHWTVIVPADQHPSVQAAHERRMHGEADRYELQLVHQDGTLVPVLVSGSPRIEEGRFAGTLTVFTDITEHKQVEEELQQSLERLRRTFDGTVQALASAIRTRNPYMAGHQRRVTQLACAIAREMGLPEEQIEGIRVAGLIHDIGKISVPVEILSNPNGISDLEYGIIKAHPQIGYDILKAVEFPWPVAEIVLQHNERLDGSGYPQGLSGDEILLEARIIGVADVVDAMSSHQPYRAARGLDKALEEISQNRGVLYDPGAVGACLKLFKQKEFKFEQGRTSLTFSSPSSAPSPSVGEPSRGQDWGCTVATSF
ncbi:MAG: response regulator [Anaerolineales bacterium]|nr:response regulator [Anaerolineales bacterium]